jgi:PAS domain S-box-containing protein
LVYVATAAATTLFVQHRVDPELRVMLVAVPWLAVGVGVAGVLLGGARLWPALFIGSWVVWGVIVGDSVITVTVDAVAEAGSIVLIARLLSVWGFHRSFDRFRDPLVLLAAATVGRFLATSLDWVGAFIAAWLTPGAFSPAYRQMMTDVWGTFPALTPAIVAASVHWSVNSIAGIVLVVPLVVPLAGARPDTLLKAYLHHSISFLVLGLTLLAWCVAALYLPAAATQALLITALMLVAWASVRFGPPVAAFATLTMSLVATAGVGMRVGPLASSSPIEGVAMQWGFIALLALTGLSLTALLAERRRDLQRLKVVAERYQQLFKSNPSPLWVAEPGGGRILMVNDEALRHYGFSETEFLAMTVGQLAAEPVMIPALASAASATASDGGTRTVRHRTRAGTFIDVELVSTPIELDGRLVELYYALDVTDRVALRSRILAAVELERQRLVQELHDGLGQVLTGLNFGIQAAAVRASRGASVDGAFIDFLVDASNNAAELCRQLTRGVSPLQDANGDLLEALRRLPNSLPPGSDPRLEVEVDSRAPLRLSLERSEHLYRVVQEAVTNALKHARAALIRVRVAVTPETVQVGIEDDGVGIQDAVQPTDGIGMRSMGLRAAAVGATVEMVARPRGGTLIRCECPQQERIESPRPAKSADSEPRTTLVGRNMPTPAMGSAVSAYLGRCLLLAVACCGGLAVTVVLARIIDPRLVVNGSRLAVPSLLVGLSAAGLIMGGGRLWPGVFVGTAVGAALLLHQPWLYAIYYGADATLAALIMLELLSRWRFSRAFDRWQDPLLLLGAAIVGGSVIQTLDFVGMMSYQWLRPGELGAAEVSLITSAAGATPVVTGAFLSALGRWWADCVAGVMLFVPLLVATPPILRTLRGHHVEAGFWSLALLGWVASMFMLTEVAARLPLVAMALVLLVWAVVRFGVAMASLAISVCAVSATLSFVLQRGVLTTIGVDEGIDTLWGFLVLLTATGTFLTVLFAERNRTLREFAATAQRHRRLFEHGPHPLWVQDAASGRILMVNEQAIRHYGYSEDEWLALTIDDLAAKPTGTVPLGPTRDYRSVETRHRLKSGACIDVELSHAPIDMDGRPTLLCFAIDVTERNALRRRFLEATDLERRRLAKKLHGGIGRALEELELAAKRFKQRASAGPVDSAAIELIAQAGRHAAAVCRQTAHGAA